MDSLDNRSLLILSKEALMRWSGLIGGTFSLAGAVIAQAQGQSSSQPAPTTSPLTRAALVGTWATPWQARGYLCFSGWDPNKRVETQYFLSLNADSSYSDHCRQKVTGKVAEEISTANVTSWHLTGDTLWIGERQDSAWAMYRVTLKDKQLVLAELLSKHLPKGAEISRQLLLDSYDRVAAVGDTP